MTNTEFLNIGDIQGRLMWMEELAVTLDTIIVLKATSARQLLVDGLVEFHVKAKHMVHPTQFSNSNGDKDGVEDNASSSSSNGSFSSNNSSSSSSDDND